MRNINFLIFLVLIEKGTCATTGDGLYDGLDWLCTYLNKHGASLKARIKKAKEEQARKEEERRQKIEGFKKSILLISGYIREFYEFEAEHRYSNLLQVQTNALRNSVRRNHCELFPAKNPQQYSKFL